MSLSDEELEVLRTSAERLLRNLQDINSSLRPTREFLEARGLTNVRQLDHAGKAELVAYLENEKRLATN